MKKIEILSPERKLQQLYVFDAPLPENNAHFTIGASDREELWKQHEKIYGTLPLKLPEWREDILCIPGRNSKLNFKNPEMRTSTSYHAQAIRDFGVDGAFPATITGIISTSDKKLILGLRAGFVQNGKMSIVPIGYLNAKHTNNHIFEQFYDESVEEIGIDRSEYIETNLIGYQTDPDFTRGINFVLQARTSLDSQEVQKRYNRSFAIYQQTHTQILAESENKKKARKEAKQAVLDAGYKNLNVGDHHPLIFIDSDLEGIEKIVKEQSLERHPLMGLCKGSLKIYLEYSAKAYGKTINNT